MKSSRLKLLAVSVVLVADRPEAGVIEKAVDRNQPGFSVTRDGCYIAWSQIDHAEADLMMIANFL